MDDAARFLQAYDEQLRTEAEIPGADSVVRLGPLRLASYPGGRGFITYRSLEGFSPAELVPAALAMYRASPDIDRVEWKTRGHDHAPGLHEALVAAGFTPDEPESIMIGRVAALAVDVPLPSGVTLRQITAEDDVRAMCAMVAAAFEEPVWPGMAEALLHRLTKDDGMELWVAEAGGEIVCAGRLELVAGTEFAGIWGGATLPAWRGRGIYRALTAVRARSALRLGKTLVHSDSTEFSRPILERAGLVTVSTTTPYLWTR